MVAHALLAAVLCSTAGAARSKMSAMSRLEQDSKWLFGADAADSAAAQAQAQPRPATLHQAAAAAPAKKPAVLLAKQVEKQSTDMDAALSDEDTPKSVPPLISKLKAILGELKERRENIQRLEKSLAQEKSMLEEGRHMLSLATTKKGKRTFEHQVQSSEQIYKDTASLLADSKAEALSAATSLIKEMDKARELGTDIITEAHDQLKFLDDGSGSAAKSHGKQQKAQQADDDSQDADDSQDDDDSSN